MDQFYSRKERLIVTTNKTPKHFFDEPRIMSRPEMCLFVELNPADFRFRKAREMLDSGSLMPLLER